MRGMRGKRSTGETALASPAALATIVAMTWWKTILAQPLAAGPRVSMACAAALSGWSCAALAVEGWAVPDARERFAVVREGGRWPASAGAVRLFPGRDLATPTVAVVADGGARVGARLVWSAPGEPLDVVFDTSKGAAAYHAYVGEGLGGGPPWTLQAGIELETRRRVESPVDTWAQMQVLWAHAAPVQGRSLVERIFDGQNRHGPSTDFCSHYHGFLQIAQPGPYLFATVSDDASFLSIDGRQIAEAPGFHGAGDGDHGEHAGTIALTPGLHAVDYWHVQGSGPTVAELAWRLPGRDRFEVVPPEAFAPVATFACRGAETPGGGDAAAFAWEMARSTILDSDVGAPALVEVRLRLMDAAAGARARWTFDDGTGADGAAVTHLFPRLGLRTVAVEVAVGTTSARRTRAIAVHPQWLQGEDFPEAVWHAQRTDLLARDPATLSPADVAPLVDYAERVPDLELLRRLGAAALPRSKAFSGAAAGLLLRLGLDLQAPEVRDYQAGRTLLTACAAAVEVAGPVAARARLHLGGLLVHAFLDAPAAQEQLRAIAVDQLNVDERRLLGMYQGDAVLAAGDVDGARAHYLATGTAAAPGDLKYALQRRSRIEEARAQLAQGDSDAAEGPLRAIEWETPVERLGTETGLLLVRVWTARQEYPFARSRCRLMLTAAPDDAHRPEVLLALAHVELAAGRRDAAADAVRRLIADHPYSEAAARAKDLALVKAQGATP